MAYLESFSTPWGVFSLEHRVNCSGLRTQTSAITEVAKYPLHLGGVKMWLKEDLLNSKICVPSVMIAYGLVSDMAFKNLETLAGQLMLIS